MYLTDMIEKNRSLNISECRPGIDRWLNRSYVRTRGTYTQCFLAFIWYFKQNLHIYPSSYCREKAFDSGLTMVCQFVSLCVQSIIFLQFRFNMDRVQLFFAKSHLLEEIFSFKISALHLSRGTWAVAYDDMVVNTKYTVYR